MIISYLLAEAVAVTGTCPFRGVLICSSHSSIAKSKLSLDQSEQAEAAELLGPSLRSCTVTFLVEEVTKGSPKSRTLDTGRNGKVTV